GGLPLLGHALMETWLRRRGSQLTLEGYHAAGGVSGAIAQRADELCEQMSDGERDAARRLLLRLTNPGDGTADTRRRVDIASLRTDPELLPVMHRLASARLLTADEETVEVAHEALLGSWPRLRRWIDDDRENLQTRRRISNAAREWETRDRDPDLLYRGTPLSGAIEWAEGRQHELEPLGQEFLAEAAAARAERIRVAEAEQARRRGTRRIAVGALALFALAALVASVIAFGALRSSQDDEAAARLSQAQALAAAAAAEASDRPLVATALALESIARSDPPTAEARSALVAARVGLDEDRWLPQAFGDPVNVGDMLAATITRDGSRFVTGGRDGSVVFWDRVLRTEMWRVDQAHDRGVQDFDISADGRWLVSVGGTQARLWDLEAEQPAPQPLAEVREESRPIWNTAFSPDSSRVAIVSETDGLAVVDRATGAPVGEPFRVDGFDMLSVAFLDDDTIIVGTGRGGIWTIEADTGAQVGERLEAHRTFDIWELVVHPTGGAVVSVSDEGTAKVWAVRDRQLIEQSTVDALSSPAGAMWTRDGEELVFGAADGRLYRVDPATGDPIQEGESAAVHAEQVNDAAQGAGWVVSLADDQLAQVWNYIGDQAGVGEPMAEVGVGSDIALSPSEGRVVVADGTAALVLDSVTGELVRSLPIEAASVAFIADDRVVTGSVDGTVELWDVTSGQSLGRHTEHGPARVLAIAAAPDGGAVASAGSDGSMVFWDQADLTTVRVDGHGGLEATAVVADSDAGFASVGADNSLRFWRADGTLTDALALGLDGPRGLARHPTADLVAVGGSEESIRILRLDGEQIGVPLAPLPGGVWDLAFTPDGRSLVTSGRDGEVLLWDWATATQLGDRLPLHGTESNRQPTLAVGRSGVTWSTGADGTVRRLDVLDTAAGCAIAADVLDERMRQQFLSGDTMQSC
ncbi:MAG: hypothetical protein HKN26_04810, partial [Acidimicrobiales bacterium]|nr:hypothetical protein [Acidimicrobiales bacterium]